MKLIKQKSTNEMCDILLHQKVFEIINWNKNDSVLILGAGQGAFEKKIKNKVKSITSIDINSNNWKGDNEFIKVDLNKSKWFKSKLKFDKIIAIEIIEHINDTTNFLKNIKRLSRKDTVILISTPNINSIKSRLYFLINGYLAHFSSSCTDYGHINPIHTHIFKFHLKKFHFKIIERTYNRKESKYIIYKNNKNIIAQFLFIVVGKLFSLFIRNKEDVDKSIIIYKLKLDSY